MRDQDNRVTIRRQDYSLPDFLIDQVDLDFNIDRLETRVSASLNMRRNPAGGNGPLVLDGVDLVLEKIAIDGRELSAEEYRIEGEQLVIEELPESFELSTVSLNRPAENTALEGLYPSGDFLLTQCEAEGFRKITWFLDRPDVMARFRVRIEADQDRYPVLLSNGNCVEQGTLEENRHFTVWDDPHPKPSYLFALVAGDLECLQDEFVTREGRRVTLKLLAESENMDKVDHAMACLKRAMAWDEQRFDLCYDLDLYHVVATNDFNMGAMENKSLNIFNAKYVLARPDTATDADYLGIEGVIGHEYFHNWTGNRVTCRDWFQLSLKEGLTVFRDQEFSADMSSRAVKRINSVRMLRAHQFAEDAGPMAHPVRPDSYMEINNFYTLTVYEKGSEVVRLYHTLLGEAGFKKGLALYFQRHDGQAVTCDDFRAAMADANGVNLDQFGRWYSQAGTPVVTVAGEYDAEHQRYTLTLSQQTPATPGQTEKLPLVIPVRLGLVGADGQDLPLTLVDGNLIGEGDVAVLDQAEQSFVFEGIQERPVPSVFRGFSAPVIVKSCASDSQLAFLMARDVDSYNRWDAGQQLATRIILKLAAAWRDGTDTEVPEAYLASAGELLMDQAADPALIAEALTLPDASYLAEQICPVDVEALHEGRRQLSQALATGWKEQLRDRYLALTAERYQFDSSAVAARSLRNRCLMILTSLADEPGFELARQQIRSADNMTDSLAALVALVHNGASDSEQWLGEFRQRWHNDPLVMDKWLSLQASSPVEGTLERVIRLMGDEVFSIGNPNKVRSLIGAFSRLNPVCFHAADGEGYEFLAEQVLAIDKLNPQVAARLVGAFNGWTRFDQERRAMMRAALERVVAEAGLSPGVFEIVSKALAMEEP